MTNPYSPFAAALEKDDVQQVVRDALLKGKPQLSQWLSACDGTCSQEQIDRATTALRLIGRYDLGATPEIINVASTSKNKTMQFAAIQALGLSKDPGARNALLTLSRHEDWLVRTTAIENLDPHQTAEAERLREALQDDFAMIRDVAKRRLDAM